MASESVLRRLAAEFDDPPQAIGALVDLLADGAPSQFIATYRRDETGDLSEDRIAAIQERWHFLQDLEARKAAILQQATERGSSTDRLQATLAETYDQDLIDDIYQLLRPRRRTPGMQAEERGLGPLAEAIHHRQLGARTLPEIVADYMSAERGLATAEAVLVGALYILAERYAADPELRAQVRDELSRGLLKASAAAPDRKGAGRYREFFALQEPVRRISATRMLALRHAERDGIVQVELCLPEGRELEIFRARFAADLAPDAPLMAFLDLVFRHAYEQLVRPACEADIRRRFKERADREIVRAFARTLRSQLLSPPLGPHKAMAVRASSRTVSIAVVAEDGAVALHRVMHLGPQDGAGVDAAALAAQAAPAGDGALGLPTAIPGPTAASPDPTAASPSATATNSDATTASPSATATVTSNATATATAALTNDATAPAAVASDATAASPAAEIPADNPRTHTREEVIAQIAEALRTHQPKAIAVPHGRRQELSLELVRGGTRLAPEVGAFAVPIDEATSAMYATSSAGRKALPSADVGLRTAVSLARRLQDPLLELLGMDPRDLGGAHSLAEVHQGTLARQLDMVVASCLARVGVDANRAGLDLLVRLPGLTRDAARALLDHRRQVGGFRTREALRGVPGVDERTFRHVAGFLRVYGGDEPLDATAVHPESYELARRIAALAGKAVTDVLGQDFGRVDLNALVGPGVGRLRVLDVLTALESHGRDARGAITAWSNEGVRSLADLQVDMELRGRVTNVTDFGAFVDLGVGQDGLVHVSQIPAGRLRRADRGLCVGEVITVYVLRVDPDGKRISLSMHRPRRATSAAPRPGERGAGERAGRRGPSAPRPRLTRAARAPEGRRGERRGPRREPVGPRGAAPPGPARERTRGDSATPRVITVESDRPVEPARGHKGELRSLTALRALLDKQTPVAETESGPAQPAP